MTKFVASHKSVFQLALRLHKSQAGFHVLVLIDGAPFLFNPQTESLSRYSFGVDEPGLEDRIQENTFLTRCKSVRLALFSHQLPLGKLASIHSSRRPSDLETQTVWFDYLRSALLSVRRKRLPLISAEKTTCHPFAKRAAQLMGVPFFDLKVSKLQSVERWSNQILNQKLGESTIHLSPELGASQFGMPTVDYFLMTLAKSVFVIAARKNGNTFWSVNRLLRSIDCEKTVLVANEDDLVEASIRQELSGLGAVKWLLLGESHDFEKPNEIEKTKLKTESSRMIALDEWDDSGDFVFHCTRQRRGVWPDQNEQDLVDQLLFGDAEGRSICDVLMRIASMRTLISTSELNRGRSKVVCFTARTLNDIKTMRVFRPHLSKWDFEPFGVGIRKSVVMELGGKEVRYGTDESYEQLNEEDRPFFQLAFGKATASGRVDWTKESEWRVIGDIHLGQISTDDIVFFVSDTRSAMRLQTVWDGTIVVMNCG